MTDQLIKLNSLKLNQKNIWANPRETGEFDYSDGVDEEQYLIEVLTQTQSLELGSLELRNACRDWVAEYHLGSVRANLLAHIKIPEKAKVLEVGCGCGAITRYIGELGLDVDAVEGSPVRAEIAQLRNRDLANVNIIQHNFNTLVLPDNHYDVVLFIGVLEYAKRFIDNQQSSSEQAVVSLLKKAAASLTENGIIIIAIENRTGYKYRCGAFEDHLARANAGIENYAGYEFAGIKTYDCVQWQSLIDQASLKHHFFYPFADYKFPTVIIQGRVEQSDQYYLASQVHSHDMISDWLVDEREDYHWQSELKHHQLAHSSNSFGIIASKNLINKETVFSSQWAIHDPAFIKPSLRLTLTNLESDNFINNNNISHHFNKLPDSVVSISKHWQQQLFISPGIQTISELCSNLLSLLKSKWPNPILVDFDQLFQSKSDNDLVMAKYWDFGQAITPTQQFFHFVCGFLLFNRKLLCHSDAFNYVTLAEIIHSCLTTLDDLNEYCFADLLAFEQSCRHLIYHPEGDIKTELDYLVSTHHKFKFKHINAQLFWADNENEFYLQDSVSQRIKQTGQMQTIRFYDLNPRHRYIRFDPCDHEHGNNHFCHVHSIEFVTDKLQTHACVDTTQMTYADLQLIDESKHILKVTGIDPQIKFQVPDEISHNTSRYQLEIQLQWLGV